MVVDLRPPNELVVAARRTLDIQWTQHNANNRMMARARSELNTTDHPVRKNSDISKEAFAQLAMGDWHLQHALFYNPDLDGFAARMEKAITILVEKSPFIEFVNDIAGLGTFTFGRLWALIGDPAYFYKTKTDGTEVQHERTIGQLFQYSGVGDPENKRAKGRKLKSNPKVGPRLAVIAENTGVKSRGTPHYRWLYDEIKADCVDEKGNSIRVHTMPCFQCGTKSAKQAADQKELDKAGLDIRLKNDVAAGIGDLWRKGHIAGHALRMVKREFLRDLYEYRVNNF